VLVHGGIVCPQILPNSITITARDSNRVASCIIDRISLTQTVVIRVTRYNGSNTKRQLLNLVLITDGILWTTHSIFHLFLRFT
jgi:hypothetical protein